MQVVKDCKLRKKLGDLAQTALDHHQPDKYRITVDRNAILKNDDMYHIVVVTENDVRDRDFYHALADAEAELEEKQKRNILLVPAIGD
jgi:hypothetical protein